MAVYSIADLSRLTGIKAHTIRTWEQRFGLLNPGRTPTNIRLYDDAQLKRLLSINALLQTGMKISSISQLSDKEMIEELGNRLESTTEQLEPHEVSIMNFVQAALFYDEKTFETEYRSCVLKHGVEGTFVHIIYPVLKRLGLLWVQNKANPAQEHFMSHLIKKKLYAAIDAIKVEGENSDKIVLFLPEWEEHEIGLLLGNLLFKKAGKKVIHLGSKVPMDNVVSAVQYHNPGKIFTILVSHHKTDEIQKMFDQLHSEFSNLKMFLTGSPDVIEQVTLNPKCTWIRRFEDFSKII